MGGRGASSSSERVRRHKGGDLKPSDILSTTALMGDREKYAMSNDIFSAVSDVYDEYGLQLEDIQVATLKQGASAIAYYDGANVAFNKAYMDEKKLNASYADCVTSGFHPSNGSKTPAEAVAYHELGHALTDAVGRKMGVYDTEASATRIVNEARKYTAHKGVVQMASKISGYATHSNAEAIAEAFADHKCNGSKARAESKAIVKVVDSYLKP